MNSENEVNGFVTEGANYDSDGSYYSIEMENRRLLQLCNVSCFKNNHDKGHIRRRRADRMHIPTTSAVDECAMMPLSRRCQ